MYTDNPSKRNAKKSPLFVGLVTLQLIVSLFVFLVYLLAWLTLTDSDSSVTLVSVAIWGYYVMLVAFVPAAYGVTFIRNHPDFRKWTHRIIVILGWVGALVFPYLFFYVFLRDLTSSVERWDALIENLPHLVPMLFSLSLLSVDTFVEGKKPSNMAKRAIIAIYAMIFVGIVGVTLPLLSINYSSLAYVFQFVYTYVFHGGVEVARQDILFNILTTISIVLPFLLIVLACKNEAITKDGNENFK